MIMKCKMVSDFSEFTAHYLEKEYGNPIFYFTNLYRIKKAVSVWITKYDKILNNTQNRHWMLHDGSDFEPKTIKLSVLNHKYLFMIFIYRLLDGCLKIVLAIHYGFFNKTKNIFFARLVRIASKWFLTKKRLHNDIISLLYENGNPILYSLMKLLWWSYFTMRSLKPKKTCLTFLPANVLN